MKYKICN